MSGRLHVGCQHHRGVSGTDLEKAIRREEVPLSRYKEVFMADRDKKNQSSPGSSQGQGNRSQGQGQSGRTSQSGHEDEGRHGQSKHTQGSSNPERDEQGHFTGGSQHKGSRGSSGSESKEGSETEENEE